MSVDGDLVTVRALNDRNARRKQSEPRKITAVDRKIFNRTLIELGRKLRPGDLNAFGLGGNIDRFLGLPDLELDAKVQGLADIYLYVLQNRTAESARSGRYLIAAKRKKRSGEKAV